MKITKLVILIVVSTIGVPSAIAGQGSGLCPGLTGQARTQCLMNERNRSSAQAAYDTAYLQSLTQSMQRACAAADAAGAAASAAQMYPNKSVQYAGRVWKDSRALADFALGQRNECEKLRGQLRRR